MIIAKTIKILGGYTKDEILSECVKELYNTIDSDDILKEEMGVWFVGDRVLKDNEKNILISEATQLMNSKLWKYLTDDIKYNANKLMFEKSKSIDDLIIGKSWLYVLDQIKTRLQSLSNGRGNYNDH
jgi:hypothetical protein